MSKPRRNPLDKPHFMEGIKQKWLGVGLLAIFVLLYLDIKFEFDAPVYVEAVSTLLIVFILGSAATASIKSYKAGNIREAEIKAAGDAMLETPEDPPPPR